MIIIDVETTGLDPLKNSLASIAAIDFNEPEERFLETCRIWDGAEINPNAFLVNGLSIEELNDETKKKESDIVQNFIEWALSRGDITVGGHNPSLDIAFINAALKRAGRKEALPRRSVDQHALAYAHMLKRNIDVPLKDNRTDLDSDAVMKYVGLPPEPKPHVGINGALWEMEAIHRLIYGVGKLEDFKEFQIPFDK
jgi:DNA polymerase III epsilon subunit-like protein